MNKINIPVVTTIEQRHSVRTYEKKALSHLDKEKIINFSQGLSNPFGAKVEFHLTEKGLAEEGEKLGTYGVIKGAETFFGVSCEKTESGLLAAGYEFENLILYATFLGLGTVWLAATFSRESFEKVMDIKQEEYFPAISPIGYKAEKRSLYESLMRAGMKSSTRKPRKELFFFNDFETPLTKEEAGKYEIPLEMVRLAPSATNAQPWRIVKKGNAFHFYETHKKDAKPSEVMIKKVDLGIALSHFHLTLLEQGLKGSFKKEPDNSIILP